MVRLFRQQFMILVEEVRRLEPQPVVLVYHYRWNIDPEIGSYLFKMVESLDAKFVIDDHCTGTRYFWNEVIPGDDRLAAIAASYVDRPHCPTNDFEGNMADEMEFNEAKAQRIIDLFATETLALKEVKD